MKSKDITKIVKTKNLKLSYVDGRPLCVYCGKPMVNAYDKTKGKISKYLWKCNCEGFPKNLRMCLG